MKGGCAILREMTGERDPVQRLVDWLHRFGLDGLALIFLEGIRPFGLLGAQAAYLVAPFLGSVGVQMEELAQVLEDPDLLSQVSNRIDQKVQGP
jgi:hypothetical protein